MARSALSSKRRNPGRRTTFLSGSVVTPPVRALPNRRMQFAPLSLLCQWFLRVAGPGRGVCEWDCVRTVLYSCTVWSHYRGASCPVSFYFPAFLPPVHALQQILVQLASVCASRGISGALRNTPAESRHNRSFHAVHPPSACNVPRKNRFSFMSTEWKEHLQLSFLARMSA